MQIIPHFTSVDNRFHEFAAHLHRGGAWSYFWAKLPSGRKWSHWYPAGRRPIIPAAWAGADIYFTVHPARPNARRSVNHRGRVIDIAAINCFYAEFDDKDFAGRHDGALARLLQVDTAPSAIVDSGGGFHAYWLLADPLAVTPDTSPALEASQKAWVHYAGGDLTVHDLARVLRVPGSLNFKYTPSRLVSFVHLNMATVYTLAELLEVIPRPLWKKIAAPAKPVVVERSFSCTGGGGDVDSLRRAAMVRSGQAREWDRYMAGDITGKPSHSEADLALCELAVWWYGHDAQVIEAIWQSSGLWRPAEAKEDHADYVQRTIRKALAKVRGEWHPPQRDMAAVEAAAAAVGMDGGQ